MFFIELHVLYVINTYVKFCTNQMLFTIWSINLFFMHKFNYKILKFKHLIDNIINTQHSCFYFYIQLNKII